MASEQAAKPDHDTIKAIIERDYSDLKRVRFIEACPVRILSLVYRLPADDKQTAPSVD